MVIKVLSASGSMAHSDRTQKPTEPMNVMNERKKRMAETEGFEPSIGLQTLYSLSRGAPSATRPHLQRDAILTRLTQLLSVTRGIHSDATQRGRKRLET